MPAYSFKTWKAKLVEDGSSRQTIRPRRKRPTVAGDTLMLFHGQRTKSCRRLRTERCKSVEPIEFIKMVRLDGVCSRYAVAVSGRILPEEECEALAKADGFKTVDQFFGFFLKSYGIPNCRPLEVIKW